MAKDRLCSQVSAACHGHLLKLLVHIIHGRVVLNQAGLGLGLDEVDAGPTVPTVIGARAMLVMVVFVSALGSFNAIARSPSPSVLVEIKESTHARLWFAQDLLSSLG